ncbi:aminopeptidase [Candidatus Woesearchaeota archaeon]|nr:aminopeptidase [Candidatus Woesearchaeota archaeon]
MHAKEHLQWLEENGLIELAKNNSDVFKKVLQQCLDVQKDERILIVTDQGYEGRRLAGILGAGYYLAARELGLEVTMIIQDPKMKGDNADDNVLIGLEELGLNNILVLSLSGKLGSIRTLSHSYRNYIRENHHRFVSATSLGKLGEENYQAVIDTINIDYRKLQEKAELIKNELDNGNELRITTDSGTDLKMELKNRAVLNTGNYKKVGTGGNIPAGEVYLAPRWKTAEGKIVVDGSSAYRGGTQLIEEPIVMDVKRGEIVDIDGAEEADNLRSTLDWAFKKAKHPWGIRRIGELGIGINPNAKIIGATIVDEKVKGTAHVGIGSNYWFGGTIYAIIHLDQVFKNPKLYIDNKLLKI